MLLVGALACDLIAERKLTPYAVGGMTMGADPIAASVAYEAGFRGMALESFIVRKEPKGHGTGQWLEGVKTFPKGAELLVVEDVVTTGGSSLKAIQAIREAGFVVKQVLTIVDREEGGHAAFAAAGVELLPLLQLSQVRLARPQF
jgi:orotate phosphoribosyltransferase